MKGPEEKAEGAGIRVWAVLSAVRKLGQSTLWGWLSRWGPALQETRQWKPFFHPLMTIIFLFITCGLTFNTHFPQSPWTDSYVPYVVFRQNLAFWNLQVPWVCNYVVLHCVKSSEAHLSKNAFPSCNATNIVFLLIYCSYYCSQIQRLGFYFWLQLDGLLCV